MLEGQAHLAAASGEREYAPLMSERNGDIGFASDSPPQRRRTPQQKRSREAPSVKYMPLNPTERISSIVTLYRKARNFLVQRGLWPDPYVAGQYLKQTVREVRKKKVYYFLGFFSCFLVVFVVGLMMTILSRTPIIFLGIAELERGQIDFNVWSDDQSMPFNNFVNYTLFSEVLAGSYVPPPESGHPHGSEFCDSPSSLFVPCREQHDAFTVAREYSTGNPSRTKFSYHSPRFEVDTKVWPAAQCRDPTGQPLYVSDTMWRYKPADNTTATCNSSIPNDCFLYYCGPWSDGSSGTIGSVAATTLYLWDFERERRMGLGRDWDYPTPGRGEAVIGSDLAAALGIRTDRPRQGGGNATTADAVDTVILRIDGRSFLKATWDSLLNRSHGLNASAAAMYRYVYVAVRVVDVYTDTAGKLPTEDTHMGVVMQYAYFMEVLGMSAHVDMPAAMRADLVEANLYHYAYEVVLNFPPPRTDWYATGDVDAIERAAVAFASDVLYLTGFNTLSSWLPILDALRALQFVSLFMALIVNVIVGILLFLSVLLIYSLLMVSVQTRTFELGVLRMVGMTCKGLVGLLVLQAFAYAVPAWASGLLAAQGAAVALFHYFASVSGVPVDPSLTASAVGTATLLGLSIPVVAAILPIAQALGRKLNEALDPERSRAVQAVEYSIERSEGERPSAAQVAAGSLLVGFGLVIYYVLPLSILSQNYPLLLDVFFLLLLCMLIGLVLLATNAQRLLEWLVVAVLLRWWEKPAVCAVVYKNLVAHRRRNRKTALMYALSLGFILFIAVSLDSQTTAILYRTEKYAGAKMRVVSWGRNSESYVSIPFNVAAELEAITRHTPFVKSTAWLTQALNDVVKGDSLTTTLSNIGHVDTFSSTTNLMGTSPGLLGALLPGFLEVGESDPGIPPTALTWELYTPLGSSGLLLGATYRKSLGVGLHTHLLLNLQHSKSPRVDRVRLQAMALVDGCAAVRLSKFPNVWQQDSVVSLTTYLRLLNRAVPPELQCGSIEDLPLRSFLIQFVDDVSDHQLNQLAEKLNRAIHGIQSTSVWDFRNRLGPVNQAKRAMNFFFTFTITVAMFICFFSLMSSMYTNVYEQTKEIGVLHALGVKKFWLYRIYVYEAFVLVLASCLLGILIGSLVGWTIVLQNALYTMLPIPFDFPYMILVTVVIMSIVCAVLSALGPIIRVMRRPIAEIVRMQTG